MIELNETEIDMVSGGLAFGGPGYGLSTAFFFAGAQPEIYTAPGIQQLPPQAAPSPTHVGAIGGGLVTAGAGNPSGH